MAKAIVDDGRYAGFLALPNPGPGDNPERHPNSMPEIVYDYVRSAIMSGRLQSGAKINQAAIAEQLGFSHVPVREALRILESEGFIALRPRRGYIVVSLDVDEIEEIFDILAGLEEKAGYLAARARKAEDVADLERILENIGRLQVNTSNDIPIWCAHNSEFHTRLLRSSGRLHLCHWARILRDSVERYIRIDATTAGRIDAAQSEHQEIFEAFRTGDAGRVGKLSRLHCAHTCAALTDSIRKSKSEG